MARARTGINAAGLDVYYEVRKALADGRLIRAELCERCAQPSSGRRPLQAHHPRGYETPHELDVEWLCAGCHHEVHCEPRRMQITTPEQRHAQAVRAGNATKARRTVAQWQAMGRAGGARGGPARWAGTNAEERRELMMPLVRAWHDNSTYEQRSAATKRGWAGQTAEQRTERSLRGAETKRQKRAAGLLLAQVPWNKRHETCTFEGCGRPHHARGLCGRCYMKQRREERSRVAKSGAVVAQGAASAH